MFWGPSPALDLQEEYLKYGDDKTLEINFLVIGGCDARHLFRTLARTYRHERRFLNLYVIEGCPELIARQLLITTLAFERTARLGLLEKTRRLLEIHGNILLRSSTSKYLIAKARQLIRMITNSEYMDSLLPYVSVQQMKYKDRDYLEHLFGFWMSGNTNQFNACELWEQRLRRGLGVRYDSRAGVFDWDYYMRIRDLANQICVSEYKHFREHGVAFTWLESEVCRPNVTMAAGVYKCGERYLHRGYLGDVVSPPYVTYASDCEDEEMLKTENGINLKRATDVAERNVMRMLYELEHRKKFDVNDYQRDTQHDLGMMVLGAQDAKISEPRSESPLMLREDRDTYVELNYGKINFLSLSALEHFPHKSQYQGLFHGVYVGHNMAARINPSVWAMVQDGALLLLESRKNLVQLKREDVRAFGDQVKQVAACAQGELLLEFDPETDDFAKYLGSEPKWQKRNPYSVIRFDRTPHQVQLQDINFYTVQMIAMKMTDSIVLQSAPHTCGNVFSKKRHFFAKPTSVIGRLLQGRRRFEMFDVGYSLEMSKSAGVRARPPRFSSAPLRRAASSAVALFTSLRRAQRGGAYSAFDMCRSRYENGDEPLTTHDFDRTTYTRVSDGDLGTRSSITFLLWVVEFKIEEKTKT
ncbi:Dynein assembly factor 3, axonemal homolog [Eumeta japonica]|uniref:Dynein assembly factor 3, axonemal homolog n=1 Tax=Eumeta variegata TaxID=151549 RepID=A0A4C1W111_EUMVA|nr:Dynein assembly factor 3, axonemal homolog [Eumeta japonica]